MEYSIQDKHIGLLYSVRASWAQSYVRGYFLARMATIAYSKSIDAFLKGIFAAQTCLRSFFEQIGISANIQHQAHQETHYMHLKLAYLLKSMHGVSSRLLLLMLCSKSYCWPCNMLHLRWPMDHILCGISKVWMENGL
ncbi:putative protein FAR1-RELATED SEQUENCE 10 [Arachis stenosperma]|uniref:putative protein FAR1-RELATED SEQUENCE 10 n=1 Tax=Arachis stenosperma TaxID=217475 RepID=UPI0025AC7567|nr:putative protein FAR1-RELATED SEQUENCE 10 [Arachis stenosperma]